MNVGELIEKLKQYDPDMPVVFNDDYYFQEVESTETLEEFLVWGGRSGTSPRGHKSRWVPIPAVWLR